jgi:sulfur carrier protein
MKAITVNGEAWQVDDQTTVADLLARYKISPRVCVVEVDGRVVQRKALAVTTLKDNAIVEIIRMMGGG